jgi:hypothetical protein
LAVEREITHTQELFYFIAQEIEVFGVSESTALLAYSGNLRESGGATSGERNLQSSTGGEVPCEGNRGGSEKSTRLLSAKIWTEVSGSVP